MLDMLFTLRSQIHLRVINLSDEIQSASSESALRLTARLNEAREIYTMIDNIILEEQSKMDEYQAHVIKGYGFALA